VFEFNSLLARELRKEDCVKYHLRVPALERGKTPVSWFFDDAPILTYEELRSEIDPMLHTMEHLGPFVRYELAG
jgi:hypothetical protein